MTIKVVSPLLLMGILAILLWLSALITIPEREEELPLVRSEPLPRQLPVPEGKHHRGSFSRPEAAQRPQEVRFPDQPHMYPSSSPSYNPETPLPPTLSLPETLREQVQKPDRAIILAQEEVASPPSQSRTLESAPVVASEPLLSIRLLKDVSLSINVPGGKHVVVPLTLNAKRVQLLAYIAWRRGELIDRDKILEHVFGWGLRDEEATEDKLSERFESHKKLLRRKIREVIVEHINKPAGTAILDPDHIDPFVNDSGFWGLSDSCRVEDLELVEAAHRVIHLARQDGKLADEIPEQVMEACEQLIAHYPGDFLEALIKKYPSEFRSWQGHSSWARKPYTLYRDYYLDALWYAAEYAWRMGQRCSEGNMEEATLRKQQEYFSRAAQRYQTYALYACNSRFDAKVTVGAHGEYGEQVGMSERALRRCVVLLGAIGRTDLINQVWSAYLTQMKQTFDQRWQPSEETQADVQAARGQTNAYRSAAQVAQMSDFAQEPEHGSSTTMEG